MKKMLKSLFGGTVAAWEMLIDLPLPGIVRNFFRSVRVSPVELACGFTVVGVLIGLVLSILGGVLNLSWLNCYVAGGIFAVAAVVLSEISDSGRGLHLLISACSRRLSGEGWSDSVLRARERDGSFERSSGSIIAMAVILLEIICFGLLAFHRASLWCVAVFAGAFTIQMLFATLDRGYGEPPYIRISPEKMKMLWLLPGIVGVFMLLCFPIAGIVAAVIVGVLGQMIHKNFVLTGTPVTADIITLCGKLTQLILLVCGIIFIL